MFNRKPWQNERAAALLRLISASWADARAETQWAAAVHLSRFHFQRVFRRYFGETPGELRRRLLLEQAAHTLCAGAAPVTMVALDAGYDSLEGFTRAFRRAYGLSPSHYRRLPFPRLHLPCPANVHYDPLTRKPRQLAYLGATTMDLTDRLIDHDAWLTRRLLERAAQMTPAQLDASLAAPERPLPFEAAEGTLRETLNRLVFTKEVWLAAVRQQPMPSEPDTSPEGLLRRFDTAFIEFAELARQVRDEQRWDEQFVDALCEPPETFSYGGMLAHVLTFSAFRRSAALKLFELAGVDDLGYGDPIEWERRRGEG
ncbi:MAG: helix-turn-helix transcriptional regulator [Anaerolineales bacterium]|nr:helix-turn-helix transcriptional regulator [Anaerolineales bacterium]